MGIFSKDPLLIIPFCSYGTATHVHIKGRALEDEGIDLSQNGLLKLLINSWKRFETDEVKHTDITVKIGEYVFHTKTDKHGYFSFDKKLKGLDQHIDAEGWLYFTLSYSKPEEHRKIQQNNLFEGKLLIPPSTASFGVISDIDDTIIHTGVASTLKWRLLWNTFFKPVSKRIPLEGAASFYQELHKGVDGKAGNPIFYVSHSPWNLYRYLDYFLTKNGFPQGPILLRSLPNPFRKKPRGEKPEKQNEILKIFATYPHLSFILIGDGGEHDATIYTEMAQQFPGRVKAIYLRSVKHKKKMVHIKGLFASYKATPALLVESSLQAFEHARKMGFIK